MLQPVAERVRRDTGTDFVVVMSRSGTRYTHPDPRQIGQQFLGHIARGPAGGDLVESYRGTLGPSVRAVVPVERGATVVGLVSVGIRRSAVSEAVAAQLPPLALAGALAAALSGLGTWLVARRVRRQTHGLDAAQLQSMYDYYDAVLHAVREGLLLVDGDGRVRLVNDECRRLLDLPEDVVGRPVSELGLVPPLERTLVEGTPRQDELHVTSARVLVLNQARAQWQGRDLGTVVTLRDRTDLQALTGELDTARGLTEALRSQAHESANRLHTVVSLIELDRAQEALEFATEELSLAQRLTDEVVGAVDEPALAALLLGKSAQASERGIDFVVGDHVVVPDGVAPPRDLVTIVGNLVDNAFDALATVEGERVVRFDAGAGRVRRADRRRHGPGVPGPDPMQAFRRGWSTKAAAEGATGGRGSASPSSSSRSSGSAARSRWTGRPARGSPCACRSRGAAVSAPLRVLVVEDEPVAADAHTRVRRPGRGVRGRRDGPHRPGRDAGAAEGGVDLVLLDMNLPDRHGLEIVRAMRAAGHTADVIAVTSARDLQVVRAAVSLGIVQYLLKPFVFASLRDRLERYRDYRLQVDGEAAVASQQDIDLALSGLRAAGTTHLPKGMSEELFAEVSRLLSAAREGRSASEVAASVGVSRVTARRYLEHLAETGLALRRSRYAGQGRPEVEYRWSS